MSSLAIAPVSDHQRTYTSAGERFAEYRRLASLVATAYKAAIDIPVITAINYDPTPGSRSPKWTPITAEYIADVELAVRKTLEFQPAANRNELQDAWERFLEDDTQIDAIQRRVIHLLAPAFYLRQLHPAVYFTPHRLVRREKQCR